MQSLVLIYYRTGISQWNLENNKHLTTVICYYNITVNSQILYRICNSTNNFLFVITVSCFRFYFRSNQIMDFDIYTQRK